MAVEDGRLRRRTRVEHVEGTRVWVVAPLRPAGEVWPLVEGSPVAVTWVTDRGVRTAQATLAAVEGDDVVLWVVEVRSVEQTQRRQAYRLEITLPVSFDGPAGPVAGQTRDLSETGARCRVPKAVLQPEVGDVLGVSFVLDEVTTFAAEARVLRVAEPDEPALRREFLDVGILLLDLDGEAAETLRRYVLEEQLRRRRHGLE
ncbi:MAG: PilZ domain-containing protein [Nitriliruptoraceae bacterium]|nr:PilZ domain-containing protein [Nitriliruptoraceae bacterium]